MASRSCAYDRTWNGNSRFTPTAEDSQHTVRRGTPQTSTWAHHTTSEHRSTPHDRQSGIAQGSLSEHRVRAQGKGLRQRRATKGLGAEAPQEAWMEDASVPPSALRDWPAGQAHMGKSAPGTTQEQSPPSKAQLGTLQTVLHLLSASSA